MNKIDEKDLIGMSLSSFKDHLKEMETETDPQLMQAISMNGKYSKRQLPELVPSEIDFSLPNDEDEEFEEIWRANQSNWIDQRENWANEVYKEYKSSVKKINYINEENDEVVYTEPEINFDEFKKKLFAYTEEIKLPKKKNKKETTEIPKEYFGVNFSLFKNSTKDFELLLDVSSTNHKVIIWSEHAQVRLNERMRDGVETEEFKRNAEEAVLSCMSKFVLGEKAHTFFRTSDATNYKIGFVVNNKTIVIQTIFQKNKESKEQYAAQTNKKHFKR